MSSRAKQKAAIDCTGYRAEMDKNVLLIATGCYHDNPGAVRRFIKLQQKQDAMWKEYIDDPRNHIGDE